MFKEHFDKHFGETQDLAMKVLVDYTLGSPRYGADKAVELDFVDSISPATVHRLLKKRNISLT